MRQEREIDAFEYCRQVTQRASKTFYWGSIFLPLPKRRAIWAVYAFCRIVDDIVDEAINAGAPRTGHLHGSSDPRRALDGWRQSLEQLYARGDGGDGPVQRAWSDMLTSFTVPLQPALELLEGVAMDLTTRRYQTFEELHLYCYRVAGTVGLLTAPIFGYEDASAPVHAVDLGIALQLTNILRDIGEDAQRDRIYLPLEEMERFGYSERDLLSGKINDAFRELIHFQITRANAYYQRAQPGIEMLSTDCHLAVRLSEVLYQRILDYICLNNYDVFTVRAQVPLQAKIMTASTYWFMQQFEGRLLRPLKKA